MSVFEPIVITGVFKVLISFSNLVKILITFLMRIFNFKRKSRVAGVISNPMIKLIETRK